jgi:hypothetical protein
MLVIEDGSIVAGADSYVTVAEIKAYADKRGLTYPADDAQTEILATMATDYLQNKCYIGELVSPNVQPLLWPRSDVWVNGLELSSTAIPDDIKNAQIELALAQYQQNILNDGSESGTDIKREKTGEIETEYYEGGKSSVFNSQRVNLYLQKYLAPIGLLRV